ATIAQNTEVGAGMAVAMKDLEIRGAGNLLGGEQSGHIASVGFDLYMRLVGEAVGDFKRMGVMPGEEEEDALDAVDTRVDLPVDAHLPHDYVPGERLRLSAYRQIAGALDDAALTAVREELVDRYGPLPTPVENLLAVAAFRNTARSLGLTEVGLQGKQVRFLPMPLRESQVLRLTRLYKGAVYKQALDTVLVPMPMTKTFGGQPLRDLELLAWARDLLTTVLEVPAPAGLAP
ncbi:MAG: TRCF domain-containing protein, partial [Mycobacteriales bacterium]